MDQWIKNTGVRYFDELTNTALLAEEYSVLARLMARIYGDQSFQDPGRSRKSRSVLAGGNSRCIVCIDLPGQSMRCRLGGLNMEHKKQKSEAGITIIPN